MITVLVVAVYAGAIFLTREHRSPEADYQATLTRWGIEPEAYMTAKAKAFCSVVAESEGIDIVLAVEVDLRLWEEAGFTEDDALTASVAGVTAFCPEQHERILEALKVVAEE
ncbi:MAG: hypothetical protein OXH95_09050 [bacterium]|nr:hypothetical protein [bacterium]